MKSHRNTLLAAAFYATISCHAGLAQTPPAAILQVDVENLVRYTEDVSDPSIFGTLPGPTTPAAAKNLTAQIQLGDIVAVNGQPAKGQYSFYARGIGVTSNGVTINDTIRTTVRVLDLEILKPDGTPIGTIMTTGLTGGAGPPGAPLAVTQGNHTVAGGTGAFLGVRGQLGDTPSTTAVRSASLTEDPASRRLFGGGKSRLILHLIPMSWPQVVSMPNGPAIFHADFLPVTAVRPASSGEVLIVRATGLGPTVPGVDPGQPFPVDVIQRVNSPLAVSVNGKPADVVNGIGWPGQVDTYRVDFRVPDGTAPGTATIQLTAAWIAGSAVGIPVQ